MYRRYEDPWMLEDRLAEAEVRLENAKDDPTIDDDALIDYYLDVEELKDRVRFAWDDQEYDENCELYGY